MSDKELFIALVLAAIAGGRGDPVNVAEDAFRQLHQKGLTNGTADD